MRDLRRTAWVLLLVGALLVLLSMFVDGCVRDLDIAEPRFETGYVFPDTPTRLMDNFARAYAGRDLETYTNLLHDDFVFHFTSCDAKRMGNPDAHLTKQQELASAANMFSGRVVQKDDGRVLPAITAIEFLHFAPEGPWREVADSDLPAGTKVCTYRVSLRIRRSRSSDLSIEGFAVFYAAIDHCFCADGSEVPCYRLIRWLDRTGDGGE